jgi:hypothetical protein
MGRQKGAIFGSPTISELQTASGTPASKAAWKLKIDPFGPPKKGDWTNQI